VVAADELPNFPHVELEQASNFAKAKIKETLAVTGGWGNEFVSNAARPGEVKAKRKP
jgi:hypothetical protein